MADSTDTKRKYFGRFCDVRSFASRASHFVFDTRGHHR